MVRKKRRPLLTLPDSIKAAADGVRAYEPSPSHKDNDVESYARHTNELARMMNTGVFKELKLSGFSIGMSMDRVPRLEIRDGRELVGTVEPVIGGGKTWWVVEKCYHRLEKNDLAIGTFGRRRFGSWDEVEQAIYEVVSNERSEESESGE